jgi:hypothetical protein
MEGKKGLRAPGNDWKQTIRKGFGGFWKTMEIAASGSFSGSGLPVARHVGGMEMAP